MKSVSVFFFLSAIWGLSSTALAIPVANLNDANLATPAVSQKLSAVIAQGLGRELTKAETESIESQVASIREVELNSPRVILARDDGGRGTSEIYICVGGKLSVVLIGLQGLKCVNARDASVVTVVFNSERSEAPVTGFAADGSVGLNGGVALDLGVMVVTGGSTDEISGRNGYDIVGRYQFVPRNSISGGTINGSVFLWGAMLGYWAKHGRSVAIFAWQPGFAFELSATDIQISR